jgi:hypothetical protein
MSTFRRPWFIPYALLVALASSCASSPGTAASGPAPTRASNSDVITRDELADPSLAGSTLLEVVRRLRPRFLNERGAA